MFLKEGSQITVDRLINGIIIASGNDASIALAEHVAGSEKAFVTLMNQTTSTLAKFFFWVKAGC
jgi:D-alanyl-D-alanine carboxypeptidase (penicillin-binding protein 5/6)